MKLAVSNIAWDASQDEAMYESLAARGFSGLEIAPTRIFPDAPYEKCDEAAAFAARLRRRYGLLVPSIQSIFFGRTENIFGSDAERAALLSHLKKAVGFAAALGCGNLVFGCPKNRVGTNADNWDTAVSFFREAGEYAAAKGTRIGMEANPAEYGTRFVNETKDAFALARDVASAGFGVNVDVGTMLANGERPEDVILDVALITHVHVSEPGLAPVEHRALHGRLAALLRAGGYQGFVSLEMKNAGDAGIVLRAADAVKEAFS